MDLSAISVRRGVTFSMLYMIVVGLGLFCLTRLQLDLYPDISFPTVLVITNYTGASPEDIETLVTRPIEGAVSSAKDAKEIQSTCKQGISLVEVKFDWGKDMEQAETDVRRKLEMVEGFLPDDADDPLVFAFDPSLQPVVMMMVSGPYRLDELRRIAVEDIQPQLERLAGIASSDVAGGLEREIRIVLDPIKVDAFGLDVNAVVSAVYRENTQVPGGYLEQGHLDFTIQTYGKYQSVREIEEVVVGAKQGAFGPQPVRLKEVARVDDGFREDRRILEVDGVPAVWMIVRKQSGANTVRAAETVMEALPDIRRRAAADIEFKVIFNQADYINQALGNLSTTAMVGILISFLVLVFFLRNLRSAFIVSSAMPISVVATFAVMDFADMTLNIISMAGLALAIGMLVDNSIVVLENIFRLREQGLRSWEAAITGAKTVSTAVTASTLTTASVFVPVLFVPGIAGVMFQDMAVTICFSLAVSLIVALTFIPLAASRLLGTTRGARLLTRAQTRDVVAPLRNAYGQALDWTLGRRWIVGVGLAALLGATAALAVALPTEFVTEDDRSLLFIDAQAPVGTNLDETYRILRHVVDKVEQLVKPEERKMVALDVGVGEGFVSIFAKGVHAGIIRVPLVPRERRMRTQQQIEGSVRQALNAVPGLKVTVAMPFNPMGGEGDIEIQIRGHDLDRARQIGLELREALLQLPEMATANYSMEDQKPEVRVAFDRAKMAQLGISTAAVGQAVSTFFMGKLAGRYAEGGDEFDIVVRYDKQYRLDMDELRKMPVALPSGATIPLANIAQVAVALGPVDISRLDQARVTKVACKLKNTYTVPAPACQDRQGLSRLLCQVRNRLTGNADRTEGKDLGKSITRVQELLKAYAWPKDFTFYIGGTAEDFLTSFRYLALALAVSVLLVFMVMASQFESLRQPLIIIFAVPLAATGVVLMFTLTRSTMDVSSLIGVIMLVGIVVNNGIVMVDAANQLRREHPDRKEAIGLAARMRMRPVLMTSATTILAMTPMALGIGEGSASWSGMAKAVIGGLLAATLLTLFVVPTMYTLFASKKTSSADAAR